ncbi:MAG: ORF6N domain-containing protein [Bacteroidia bacterium]|nr:ORF6N domain-containing protein [Bacteroidia bacterium]
MIPDNSIRNLIKIIRNQQVMLDSDLAVLYGVETKALNQAVNRNIERFPEDFMFQLTWEECENLRSQIVTSSLRSQFVTLNSKQGQHIKYLPYAFTEQGVAMLSGVLHSLIAIEANIRIMRAFVGMRHFINENAKLFQRIETIEYNQLEIVQGQQRIEQRQFEMEHIQIEIQSHQQNSDRKIEELFQRLDEGRTNPKEGIFFDGQIFDAYVFISNLIKKAEKEIILIDNYVDESVLNILSKRNDKVNATIYTSRISHQFQLDLERYNSQYQPITVNAFNKCHDRFLIIDEEVYHIGASLKDLGKKWFAFSILNFTKGEILIRLK